MTADLRPVLRGVCTAYIVVHCVGVDEVGQEVTTPQKDDLTQDMGHNPPANTPIIDKAVNIVQAKTI